MIEIKLCDGLLALQTFRICTCPAIKSRCPLWRFLHPTVCHRSVIVNRNSQLLLTKANLVFNWIPTRKNGCHWQTICSPFGYGKLCILEMYWIWNDVPSNQIKMSIVTFFAPYCFDNFLKALDWDTFNKLYTFQNCFHSATFKHQGFPIISIKSVSKLHEYLNSRVVLHAMNTKVGFKP